jgi:hypothetical protein
VYLQRQMSETDSSTTSSDKIPLLLSYQKCSPSRVFCQGSCFTTEELVCMVKAAQHLFRSEKIPVVNDSDLLDLTKSDLWALFRDFMIDCKVDEDNSWTCDWDMMSAVNQMCPNLSSAIHFFALRPYFDGRPTDQLYIGQLRLVMQQYTHILPNLYFEGVFPSDHFKSMLKQPSIARIRLKEHSKHCWSAIMNIDTLKSGGQHWVALFKESVDSPLEYFDSEGEEVPESLIRTVLWLSAGKSITCNTLRHQEDNYNCGIYACFFILARANGVLFNTFNKYPITSADITRFRDSLFS